MAENDAAASKPPSKDELYVPAVWVGAWCLFALSQVVFGVDWSSCNGSPASFAINLVLVIICFILVVIVVSSFKDKTSLIDTLVDMLKSLVPPIRDFSRRAPRTFIVAALLTAALLWTLYGRYEVHHHPTADGVGYTVWYDKLMQKSHRAENAQCDDSGPD